MGILYIVSTPIGNIDDITVRAKKILKEKEYILCEDTRVTKKLIDLLEIDSSNKKFLPNFEHNERRNVERIIELLNNDVDIALVSDAGTPLISDPGFPLIREIRKLQNSNSGDNQEELKKGNQSDPDKLNNIQIEIVPGVSSPIVALSGSGFPTDKFTFLGYFPRKPSEKKKLLKSLKKSNDHIKSTYILFENANRVLSSLNLMKELLPKVTQICISKELTKKYESYEYGSVGHLIERINHNKINMKGEIILLINLNMEK